MTPTVFIGSSSEALPLANAIKNALSNDFKASVWGERLFELGEDALNGLLRFVQSYDFGILVLTDDDTTRSRNVSQPSPRDNVIFELGLFIGALGRRRTFAVIVQTADGPPKIPSDVLGNTAVFLPKDFRKKIDPAALSERLAYLIETVKQRSAESTLQLLPSTGLAIGYFQNFVLPVCQELVSRTKVTIDHRDVDISADNFEFTIVVPKTLSDASIQGARKFVKTRKIADFTLETTGRPYSFYVAAAMKGREVVFYDYPTTLSASHEAVRIALSGPYLGSNKHHAVLDAKEIANFRRTIRILLNQPNAAGFRDKVKIIRAP